MPRIPSFLLTLITETGERFSDFAPYVVSINDAGLVAFQAALRAGGTGVFAGNGGAISTVVDPSSHPFSSFRSHPDINGLGDTCVYADLEAGVQAVLLFRGGRPATIAGTGGPHVTVGSRAGSGASLRLSSESPETFSRGAAEPRSQNPDPSSSSRLKAPCNGLRGRTSSSQPSPVTDTPADPGSFSSIGPLGPTMNDAGTVAFRADLKSGESGIFTGNGASITRIADSNGIFSGFQGLPVVNSNGTVVFRADLKGGGQGIYTGSGGPLTPIAETGSLTPSAGRFSAFASFPSLNDAGTVAFGATLEDGGAGVFTATEGRITTWVEPDGPFESVRNALINNAGTVIFAGTPRDGQLGIFSGPDPMTDRIFAIGDPLFSSEVASFALNPVSVNDAGQVGIRVMLSDGRQVIIRLDPAT